MDIKDLKLIEKLKVKAVKAQQFGIAGHLRSAEHKLEELIKKDAERKLNEQFYCKDKVDVFMQSCYYQCDHCKIVEDTPTTT